MENCVFCKIIKQQIPSHKIYEDDYSYCFLDIHPAVEGHCLVIPKKHCTDIFDLDEASVKHLLLSAQNVAKLLKKNIGAEGVNILHASGKAAQQSAFHFHMHILPRYENDGYDLNPKTDYVVDDLSIVAKRILHK